MLLKLSLFLCLLLATSCNGIAYNVYRDGDAYRRAASLVGPSLVKMMKNAWKVVQKRLEINTHEFASDEESGIGRASLFFHPTRHVTGGVRDVPLSVVRQAYTQMYDSQSDVIYPSVKVFILDDDTCPLGVLDFTYYPPSHGETKRSLPDKPSNNTILKGIHPVLYNDTIPEPVFPKTLPKNGPTCPGILALWSCVGVDHLVVGQRLSQGARLYAREGHFLELQSDGNLCATSNVGEKYWCAMSQDTAGYFGPYTMNLNQLGNTEFRRKNGEIYWVSHNNANGNISNNYRLVIQNDGNVVAYYGTTNSYPIWTSTTAKFSYSVPSTPCDKRHYK